MSRLQFQFAGLILALVVAGCSSQEFVDVSGNVRYADGSPVIGGVRVIRFEPIKDSTGDIRKSAYSEIADDGAFSLSTRVPGDGVVTGKYAVTFTILNSQQESRSLIPKHYAVPRTTPFQVEVDADKSDYEFVLER